MAIKHVGIAVGIVLLVSCSKSPEDIVKKYWAAETVEERIECVDQSGDVEKLMRQRYENTDLKAHTRDAKIISMTHQKRLHKDNLYYQWVDVEYRSAESDETHRIYYFLTIDTENGDNRGEYLIDWKASMGIGDMTFRRMKIDKPTKPVVIYAYAKLSNYYGFEYFGRESSFLSIRLSNTDNEDIYGYVLRGSEIAKQIYELLIDVDWEPVTLAVEYSPYTESPGNMVRITNFLHPYWGHAIPMME